jgi:hypothetical protein
VNNLNYSFSEIMPDSALWAVRIATQLTAVDTKNHLGKHGRLMILVSYFYITGNYMSILNKVENTYLTILRLVALTGATLALIFAVVLGFSGASKLINSEPKDTPSVPITAQNYPKLDAFVSQNKPEPHSQEKTENLNKLEDKIKNSDLDAAAMNVSKYYMGVFEGTSLDHNKVRELMVKEANIFPEETQNAYFKSLNEFSAELLKKIAEQKSLVTAAQAAGQDVNTAPGLIDIDSALKWHFDRFSAMVEENKVEIEQRQQEYASAKASGTQELYIAAGSFGAFLLVVFIFIIIKIERNLRGISIVNSSAEL